MLPVPDLFCVPNFCYQLIHIFVLVIAFFSGYTLLNPLWTRTYCLSDKYSSKMNEHFEAFAVWDVNVTSRVNLDWYFVLNCWLSTTDLCHNIPEEQMPKHCGRSLKTQQTFCLRIYPVHIQMRNRGNLHLVSWRSTETVTQGWTSFRFHFLIVVCGCSQVTF